MIITRKEKNLIANKRDCEVARRDYLSARTARLQAEERFKLAERKYMMRISLLMVAEKEFNEEIDGVREGAK